MIAQLSQLLASSFLLLFGLLALRVVRRAGPVRRDQAALAWSLSASYFLICGGYSALHALLSAVGWMIGKKSWLLGWVGTWSFAANLARGVVAVAFAALMLALMVGRRRQVWALARSAPLAIGGVTVVSTAVTLWIDVQTGFGLSVGLAVLGTLTAVLLMAALLAAILNDGMDQLLWLALVMYTLKEAVTVSQMAVFAWWSVAPHPEVYYIYYVTAAALGAGMCLVAVRRLQLAGAGRRVPALFERLYTQRRSPVS